MTKASRFLTISLALVALVACRPASRQGKLRVRLTWLHQAQFAGVYLAEDKGFYKDSGLNVGVNAGGIDYSSVKMVTAGTDDLGLTSSDQILLARGKGVPLIALAALYQKSPVVLFSLKKNGIVRPEDLRGKKIGIKYGDNTEVPVRALLKKVGLGKDDYEEVSVSYDPTPLLDGRVDVLPGFAPNEPLSVQEKGYELNLIYVADYGINFYADVIFTREDVLRNNRASVDNFVRATLKGYEYAMAHPDEAIRATKLRSPEANETHEMGMLQISIPLWKPSEATGLGAMNPQTWADIQDILIAFGLLKEKQDLTAAIDLDAVRSNR